MKKSNAGFSLIEVAIAIVVIGLLASFTIKGGQLIQSAKLNSVYDQVTTFKVATQLFVEKYGFLPGDLPDAANVLKEGTQSGSGKGIINSLEDGKRFWQHLIAAGLLTTELIDGFPVSRMGGYFYVSNSLEGLNGTWVILSSNTTNNKNFKGALTPENAHFIDRNHDTGDPTTGDIRASTGDGTSEQCITNSKYNYKNKNKDCVLKFKIFD